MAKAAGVADPHLASALEIGRREHDAQDANPRSCDDLVINDDVLHPRGVEAAQVVRQGSVDVGVGDLTGSTGRAQSSDSAVMCEPGFSRSSEPGIDSLGVAGRMRLGRLPRCLVASIQEHCTGQHKADRDDDSH